MTTRRTMKARRALAAAAITTGLVLSVAGCGGGEGGDDAKKGDDKNATASDDGGGGDSPPSGGGSDNKILAQVKGGTNGSITLTINSAVRSEGGFLTVSGKVRNDGKSLAVVPGWQSDETELAENGLSMAGAKITDQKSKKRYLILRDTEGRCLCTRFQGGFPQGEAKEWFAQFPAPPATTTKVTFEVADLPPATIEITNE